MIQTKKDLKRYLEADAKANHESYKGIKQKAKWFIHPRLHFTRNLRFYEYYANQPQTLCNRFLKLWYFAIHQKLGLKLGYTVYKNTIDEGVCFGHIGTIIVNSIAHVGKNCTINAEVNIGGHNGGAPTIGDNVYIAGGSKIFGGVKIGRGATIGSAVVRCNVPPYAIVVGNPAKIVGYNKTPEEVVEFEKENYPEEERIPLKKLQRNYDKFFINKEKIGEYISLY